jgi:hypothetical protein
MSGTLLTRHFRCLQKAISGTVLENIRPNPGQEPEA